MLWIAFVRSSAIAFIIVMPHSQKLFSYELRCSFTYSNHSYGLEIDIKVHTRPFLAHNKTKCVTRFFEKSVRDILLESGSEGPNVGSRIILKKNHLPISIRDRSVCGSIICVFLGLNYICRCSQKTFPFYMMHLSLCSDTQGKFKYWFW